MLIYILKAAEDSYDLDCWGIHAVSINKDKLLKLEEQYLKENPEGGCCISEWVDE